METGAPIIIGITGASGVLYGVRTLEILGELGIETHLVMTKSAEMTIGYELDRTAKDIRTLATKTHPVADVGASIASGSFKTRGMLILPCSIRTLSEIATGVTSSLMSRAADVVLKERRRLVLGLRETPLHLGHLRSMTQATEMGAVVAPIVPALYTKPTSLEQVIDHSVGRMLDLFDIDTGGVTRWRADEGRQN